MIESWRFRVINVEFTIIVDSFRLLLPEITV